MVRNRWSGKYVVLSGVHTVITSVQAPEGPHIYKKDGFYYLLIAEGASVIKFCGSKAS